MKAFIALVLIVSGLLVCGAESSIWWLNFIGVPMFGFGGYLACQVEKARAA